MKISKLMTKNVQTCRTIDTLERAAQLMWDHDIGALPVVNEHGRVVGMLTDRDALMAAYTRGEPLRAIAVMSTMSGHPFTCSPDDELGTIETEMSQRQIHRVPVVDNDGHPVGIVSLNDLARASKQRREVSATEVAATLAAVCAPRGLASSVS